MPFSGEYAHGSWAIRTAAKNGQLGVLQFLKAWRLVKPLPWLASHPPSSRLTAADVQSMENYALKEATQNGHVAVVRFLNDWIKEEQ